MHTLKHPTEVFYVAWSPDGRQLATGGGLGDMKIRLWDTATGELLRELKSPYGHFSPSWSPDGRRLAASGWDAFIVTVFDAQTGETLTTMRSEIDCRLFLRTWSPQGDRIVTGCIIYDPSARGNYPVRVWDANTGEVLLELRKEVADPFLAVYSPDGRYIAGGFTDGVVIIWDAETGKEVTYISGYPRQLDDLSWSPDGYRLAGVYQGGQFLIWDILSGDEVYRDQTFNTGYTVDWSPDGKYLLLTGELSNTPEIRRVWQSKEELIAFAKECCAWRELTAAERALYGLEEQ